MLLQKISLWLLVQSQSLDGCIKKCLYPVDLLQRTKLVKKAVPSILFRNINRIPGEKFRSFFIRL